MKKIWFFAVTVFLFAAQAYAMTYTGIAGDIQDDWYVQAEYKEKYFEYNTFYHDATVTPGIMLRGMDQDFLIRVGLPGGYFAALGANYVFQNLEALFDYNNVQTLTLLAGKQFENAPGILLGLKYPLETDMADNALLIDRVDMYNFIAGLYQKGSFGLLKYSMQAVMEQPLWETDYQGSLDLSASLGFNFYNDPKKQVIDILAEVNYSLVQKGSGNSYMFVVMPQAAVRFYDDFSFVLGLEILADADNWNLNKREKLLYVVKVNYVLSSSRKVSEAAALKAQSASTSGMYPGYGTATLPAAAPSDVTVTASQEQAAPFAVTTTPTAVTTTPEAR